MAGVHAQSIEGLTLCQLTAREGMQDVILALTSADANSNNMSLSFKQSLQLAMGCRHYHTKFERHILDCIFGDINVVFSLQSSQLKHFLDRV